MKISELGSFLSKIECLNCHQNFTNKANKLKYGFSFHCESCSIYHNIETDFGFHICGKQICIIFQNNRLEINEQDFLDFNILKPDFQHILTKYKTLLIYQ